MIFITGTKTYGWHEAIRGMRNPMNSWDKSDTLNPTSFKMLGSKDHELMMKLAKKGSVHAKYRRMITVYADITAPLYWWKEFDTYKVGTVANSCSTMHTLTDEYLDISDFSCEHLLDDAPCNENGCDLYSSMEVLENVIDILNTWILRYKKAEDEDTKKEAWWQIIQLLPSSYNQKRTVMMNYEVLAGLYPMRKNHKLNEWHDFCKWIEELPYSEFITLKEKEEDEENGSSN